jgi:lipopolysaccharide cholinephosphotransferase
MRRELSIESVKKLSIDILKYIKDICEENDLRYYLAYGTLIGAIRHKGFIPWDDDIDIYMPRMDFMKLLKICSNNPDERYSLISLYNNKKYNAPLAKMFDNETFLIQNHSFKERTQIGVYVDIFVLDGVPKDRSDYDQFVERLQSLRVKWFRGIRKCFCPNEKRIISLLKYILNTPYRIIGVRNYLERMDKFIRKYDYDQSLFVGNLDFGDLDRNYIPKDFFGQGIALTFEGEKFIAPKEYDKILRLQYGDYMVLPPKEQQVSNHNYKAYLK